MTDLPLSPPAVSADLSLGGTVAVNALLRQSYAVTVRLYPQPDELDAPPAPEPEPEPPPVVDPWTPAELATAPRVWLDAANAASLTLSGANVLAWGNLGSAVVFFSQSGGGTPPDLLPTGLNGLPTIDFDGVLDKFWSTSASVSGLMGASDFAVFVVGRADTSGTNAATSWSNEGFYGDRGGWVGMPFRSVGTVAAYVYDSGGDNNPTSPYVFGTNAVFMQAISDGRNRLRLNGGAEASIPSTGLGGGLGEQLLIGRVGSVDSLALDGAISEFLIIKPAPDVETRQTIEGYLAHKWGLAASLPADHPYKEAAP